MAGKVKTVYVCQSCGCELPKWQGQCPECGLWNTLGEEIRQCGASCGKSGALSGAGSGTPPAVVQKLMEISEAQGPRHCTGLAELDRVLGGGIVKGSVTLLAGDPGIGKSTLLLQICQYLCNSLTVLYISGEESPRQLKLRANRLKVTAQSLSISACTDVEQSISLVMTMKPDIVIVDSIQTLQHSGVNSAPGSVSQIRTCTQLLIGVAKTLEIPMLIIGHVNKEGAIAGPKVLEHMVDTVLAIEGDRQQFYRVLRAVKNRFGSTNEIGVFAMEETGLREIPNPSQMMLSGRPLGVSGTCVACVMEGSRPILAEVQALASKTGFGTPRRMSTGVDYNRAALLLAVLEKRCGFFMGNLDVYVNVTGGLRIDEPAADLAICVALASNVLDKAVSPELAAIGEVGLAGELRSVSNIMHRVGECYRLGLTTVVVPKNDGKALSLLDLPGLRVVGAATLPEALQVLRT